MKKVYYESYGGGENRRVSLGLTIFLIAAAVFVTAILTGYLILSNAGIIDRAVAYAPNPMISDEMMDRLLRENPDMLPSLLNSGAIVAYEKSAPSVVYVSNIVNVVDPRSHLMTEAEQNCGAGVIYSTEGYIITNNHVIEGADRLMIALLDGRQIAVSLVGVNAEADLAVLQVNEPGLPLITIGDSDSLKVGELAIAIGNPAGLRFAFTCTQGCISGVNREVLADDGRSFRVIQTDAAVNPGSSGGALLNRKGELVGINTIKITDGMYEGMSFALPINDVIPIAEEIVANSLR